MVPERIALGLRYDGSAFHGWQSQDEHLRTVQALVEKAIANVANHPINLVCAGRTDAGVHATAQVVHFDTMAHRSEKAWIFGVNSNLPPEISILWSQPVPFTFHARFSATARRYRYILYNHTVKPAILRQYVSWYYKPLQEEKMQIAAHYLLGEHDFSAFRGSGCQSHSPVREVYSVTVARQQHLVIIEIYANAFLLHMVRNIVGALIEVGCGMRTSDWMKEVLQSQDRRCAGVTSPPQGLYLVEVTYPQEFALPCVPLGPFFL